MHLTARQIFRRASLVLGVIIIVGMLVFLNSNRASIYKELVAFNLVPRPEKLTELYFNTVDLPDAVTANQEIHFAFVIHNLETTNYQYTYVVLVNTYGMRHIIDHGAVWVQNNQYYIKKVGFHLAQSSEKQNVIVELTNKQQSIDFWV